MDDRTTLRRGQGAAVPRRENGCGHAGLLPKALLAALLMLSCALCLAMASSPDGDAAADSNDDGVIYEEDGKYMRVVGYEGDGGDVVIPEYINGKPVIGIESGAFYAKKITSIKLPDTIAYFEIESFSGCTELISVNIPPSVKYIPQEAFFCCRSLKELTFPSSIDSIGTNAFYGCRSLEEVTFYGSGQIGSSAFRSCTSLTSFHILGDVKKILDYAFYDCCSLTSIEFPDSLEKISYYAFFGCDSLKSVRFGTGIEDIRSLSFGNEGDPIEPTGFFMDDGKTSIDVEKDVGKLKGKDFEGSISKMTQVSEYTVTFYDQITYTDVKCKVGDRIQKPADPQMTGYTFQCWMDEKGREFDFASERMPAKDVLLTACWKHNIMTVTFDTKEGRVFTDTCAYSGTITLPGPGVSPPGRIFSGWQAEGDEEIHAEGDWYEVTSDITLSAVWNTEVCTVTYSTGVSGSIAAAGDADRGTGYEIEDRYAHGSAMTLLDGSSISNPGHRLAGWLASDGTEYRPGAGYTVEGDISFTAVWEEAYTMTFIAGPGSEIEEICAYGSSMNLPDGRDGSIAKAGSVLAGWKIDGGEKNWTYGLGSTFAVHSDYTFRAIWIDDADAVIFLADGTMLTGDLFERLENGTARLGALADKDGHEFLGWRFADGKTVYAPGLHVKASGIQYMVPCLVGEGTQLSTISYSFDGGVGEVTGQKAVPGMSIALPTADDVNREGFVLVGWKASDGTVLTDGSYTATSEDAVLTAVWEPEASGSHAPMAIAAVAAAAVAVLAAACIMRRRAGHSL